MAIGQGCFGKSRTVRGPCVRAARARARAAGRTVAGRTERLHSFESSRNLIRKVDEILESTAASNGASEEQVTAAVSEALTAWVKSSGVLPNEFIQKSKKGYGRRALHVDKHGRYGIIIMSWAPGQATAIHDHDNMWCVECVYKGRVAIQAFDAVKQKSIPHHRTDGGANLYYLYPEEEALSNVGNAGQLIPPKDVHMISNAAPGGEVAVTIHVYGGHMEKCQIFTPVDVEEAEAEADSPGRLYKRESKSLYFTREKDMHEVGL